MTPPDLERRIRALEDIEEIKVLKRRYCAYCDDSYDADGIASLFTSDAVWDGGLRGKCEGREEIRSFFQKAPERMPFAIHMVLNPIIEVNGDTAKGTWYLFQPCTWADGNRAVWGSARYDEDYVRVDGRWMFQHLRVTSYFWTPFEDGWVKTQFA
jgi:ketosteroid isomerase-like protein